MELSLKMLLVISSCHPSLNEPSSGNAIIPFFVCALNARYTEVLADRSPVESKATGPETPEKRTRVIWSWSANCDDR